MQICAGSGTASGRSRNSETETAASPPFLPVSRNAVYAVVVWGSADSAAEMKISRDRLWE